MPGCVFCSIVAGGEEDSVVYADDRVVAFMDIRPVTVGHVLVVTRDHLPGLSDVPAPLAAHLFVVGQRLAGALRRSTLPCEGINMFVADGDAAFQEVLHFHLHVFPRTRDDTFRISADWRKRPREELDAAALSIREALVEEPSDMPLDGPTPDHGLT